MAFSQAKYFKEWYKKNKQRLLVIKKSKYENNPVYRNKIKEGSKKQYLRIKKERNNGNKRND